MHWKRDNDSYAILAYSLVIYVYETQLFRLLPRIINYSHHLLQNHFRKLLVHIEQITIVHGLATITTCFTDHEWAKAVLHRIECLMSSVSVFSRWRETHQSLSHIRWLNIHTKSYRHNLGLRASYSSWFRRSYSNTA